MFLAALYRKNHLLLYCKGMSIKTEVVEMNTTKNKERKESDRVPVSPTVTIVYPAKNGTIEGLDEEELLTERELEKMVFKQMWEPILELPVRINHQWIRPTIDEDGDLEWGAFGSVDFARMIPAFDKMRYKIDRLKEELADETIFIDIINDRIEGRTKYVVLKNLKMGLIELEHITDPEVHSLARHCLRAWRLRREIRDVQQVKYRSGR